jgi:histidinol-phosphate phosphatase family protein
MYLAAAGLALRGHSVEWAGGGPPDGAAGAVVRARGFGLNLARDRADVVIGTGARLARASFGGLLTHAHVLVSDLELESYRRWSAQDRWAWDALYSVALIDGAAGDEARATLPDALLERVALWPEAGAAATPDPADPDVEVLERACERALARHRGYAPRAAAFLDRDGTLVVEREYLSDPDELELLPGVTDGLKRLRAAGFALIVVSNQAGVGRGRYSLTRAYEVMARLRGMLRAHGVEPDSIYFCPHHPDDGCLCRKPGTLLMERAAEDHQLELGRSVMVGDKRLDAEAGQRAGGAGVLVRTGYGVEEASRAAEATGQRPPDHVSGNLADAARWIVERAESLPSSG